MNPVNEINLAFAQRPELRQAVFDAIARNHEPGLIHDIARYIIDLQCIPGQPTEASQEENPSKKRKLEHRSSQSVNWDKGTFCTVVDISFSIPQRKKLSLELSLEHGLRATNVSGDVEFGLSWESVKDVVCLPVPEKAQSQYNFCIFADTPGDPTWSQVLWTVPDTVPKDGAFSGGPPARTYKTLLIALINKALRPYKKQVVEPQSQEFASRIQQAHRKGETAFHVKAFRGSKDGFLFLLSTGIVWGFKKPLEFFAFDSIDSVSYISVLQRTFNLNIAVRTADDATQEFEFSMIDQADFAGIDAYVKRHELQDASMAEQRRAKKLNINGVRAAEAAEGADDQEGELEKAKREAEDLEDEEEEDENFDPGSEGESEGSGESSEEDEGGGSGLVEQELGSEAEDVDEDD